MDKSRSTRLTWYSAPPTRFWNRCYTPYTARTLENNPVGPCGSSHTVTAEADLRDPGDPLIAVSRRRKLNYREENSRVKLNRVFFPRRWAQARSLGCGFAR